MNRMNWLIVATLFVATAGAAVAITASLGDEDEQVALDQVPPAVRKTILLHSGDRVIEEIERSIDRGVVVYEVEVGGPDGGFEFVVDADGAYLGLEDEDDDQDDDESDDENSDDEDSDDEEAVQISFDDAPRAVRRAFIKLSGGAAATEVEQITDDGLTYYELDYAGDRGEAGVVLSADGEVMLAESAVTADELPAAVREALEARFPMAMVAEAEAVQLFFYEVELDIDGELHEVMVFASGEIEDDDDSDDDEDSDSEDDDEDEDEDSDSEDDDDDDD